MKYHLNYFDKWGTEAADWVVEKARAAAGVSNGDGGDGDTSGAGQVLKHPVANVFLAIIVLFGL